MAEKEKIDHFFDSARQAPTELSRSRVETMIKGFSSLDSKGESGSDSNPFFNLKNIIIMSIPISIAIGLFLLMPSKKEALIPNKSEVKISEHIEKNQENISITSGISPDEMEVINYSSKLPIDELVDQSKKEIKPVTDENPQIEFTSPSIGKPVEKSEGKTKSKPRRSLGSKMDMVKGETNKAPELSALKMRKMKRKLYKNLVNDKIILSKGTFVEIDLPGDRILVNGKEMTNELFLKYAALTKDAGTGPVRKIKMDRQYIKIGDFNSDGFKGSGYGTFQADFGSEKDVLRMPDMPPMDNLFSDEKNIKKQDSLLDVELKSRDLFAKEILEKAPREQGRKRLFSPNIRHKEMKELHEVLYAQLLSDKIVKSETDFVLVELSKEKILINGTLLADADYQLYKSLISEYKIKFVLSRQIRLSGHSISVGDYAPGLFSGTTTTFEVE